MNEHANQTTLRRWLLMLSLVLNLFLLAAIAGGAWRWWAVRTHDAPPVHAKAAEDATPAAPRGGWRVQAAGAQAHAAAQHQWTPSAPPAAVESRFTSVLTRTSANSILAYEVVELDHACLASSSLGPGNPGSRPLWSNA